MANNNSKFISLREQYSHFQFLKYEFSLSNNSILMQFFFKTNELSFSPKMKLNFGKYGRSNINICEIEGLVYQIGLIELVSYWKATCSPIIVLPHILTEGQQNWWKKLYYKGLGEFFYQNEIDCNQDDFVNFSYVDDEKKAFIYCQVEDSKRVIVPIGGGKDSVVTLEKLRKENEVIPFIINPRGATLNCANVAGFETVAEIVVLEREIDKQLLECNKNGFLNGHTPFSAMLAFYTLLVSYVTDTKEIALSNEASADEVTVLGTDVNHQYSKSLEFENDFRSYVTDNMNNCAHYFSYLRNYSELQIAEMFAKYPPYFSVFRSCNAGSKENIWCCQCPKCLFAYIILAPFIDKKTRFHIFGQNLLEKENLQPIFRQLIGLEESKPFECVGTISEVREALNLIIAQNEEGKLLEYYIELLQTT